MDISLLSQIFVAEGVDLIGEFGQFLVAQALADVDHIQQPLARGQQSVKGGIGLPAAVGDLGDLADHTLGGAFAGGQVELIPGEGRHSGHTQSNDSGSV